MTSLELSKLKPKEMAAYICELNKTRYEQRKFVNNILMLMDARILNGDYKYWNDVLENL